MTKTQQHESRFRVRSYELDPYDHLNNGAYINWYEDARELFLREQERTWMWYPDELGTHFVVVNIACDYRAPAFAGESLVLRTRLAKIGTRSVVFRQSLRRDDGKVLCRARVVMCFAQDNVSVEVPNDFREHFAASPEGDVWTADEGGERA
ncbi:MAG: acyl-CoA thioesterase [Planctomycetes bacterium]|nr:acyl-CoA thioesterase [Planctomycetota bacterium]